MVRVKCRIKKELEQWDVEFDSKLLRMGERVLPDEEMVQKNEESDIIFVMLFSFFPQG